MVKDWDSNPLYTAHHNCYHGKGLRVLTSGSLENQTQIHALLVAV